MDDTTAPFLRALISAGPTLPSDADQKAKKNYAERLSRGVTQELANLLRKFFPGILPDESGARHESRARTAKGFKRLDVNFSTHELGLGLGVSVKTLNFKDAKSRNYRKNFTRYDGELRAEAKDYHNRQPFSVLVAVICMPSDACDDATGKTPSSFGNAVKYFRNRSGRKGPRDEEELFEAVFIGLYESDGPRRGEAMFFDVLEPPPKSGRPKKAIGFQELADRIRFEYDSRNDPPFEWEKT